jgi:hypothetical protein
MALQTVDIACAATGKLHIFIYFHMFIYFSVLCSKTGTGLAKLVISLTCLDPPISETARFAIGALNH